MNQKVRKVFINSKYESDPELSLSVWRTICKEERREYTRQVFGYSFLGLLSISSLIFIIQDLGTSITTSGFYEYVSLLASDGGIVTTYWKEFMLSVTESLPVTDIALSLLLVYILFISFRHVAHQYKRHLLAV